MTNPILNLKFAIAVEDAVFGTAFANPLIVGEVDGGRYERVEFVADDGLNAVITNGSVPSLFAESELASAFTFPPALSAPNAMSPLKLNVTGPRNDCAVAECTEGVAPDAISAIARLASKCRWRLPQRNDSRKCMVFKGASRVTLDDVGRALVAMRCIELCAVRQ
jgi:hypothetical protein